MKTLAELAARWRQDAALLEAHGAGQAASTARLHADQLEAAVGAAADEVLSLREAARESGYSVERLRHKLAAGEVENAGRKGAPAVRRADLPRKAKSKAGAFDASGAARRIVQGARRP